MTKLKLRVSAIVQVSKTDWFHLSPEFLLVSLTFLFTYKSLLFFFVCELAVYVLWKGTVSAQYVFYIISDKTLVESFSHISVNYKAPTSIHKLTSPLLLCLLL